MNKRIYMKPEMVELLDAGMVLLAGSGLGTDSELYSPTRQENSDFTEDDLDSEE